MTDSSCLVKIIADVRPTEIYNLAAQSHVKVGACIFTNDYNVYWLSLICIQNFACLISKSIYGNRCSFYWTTLLLLLLLSGQ